MGRGFWDLAVEISQKKLGTWDLGRTFWELAPEFPEKKLGTWDLVSGSWDLAREFHAHHLAAISCAIVYDGTLALRDWLAAQQRALATGAPI